MARIKKRKLRWKASPSPQVVGYKLYWTTEGTLDYSSESTRLGNVTEIVLPDDIKAFADLNGPVTLGIAAIDEVGNESDLITLKAPFQFKVPQAPSDLALEVAAGASAEAAESGASVSPAMAETDEPAGTPVLPEALRPAQGHPGMGARGEFGRDDEEQGSEAMRHLLNQNPRRFGIQGS